MRRGVVGAQASGDARVRRACGAVRKGARAEAGWCRAPHARAEGFMGVRLRTFPIPSHPIPPHPTGAGAGAEAEVEAEAETEAEAGADADADADTDASCATVLML